MKTTPAEGLTEKDLNESEAKNLIIGRKSLEFSDKKIEKMYLDGFVNSSSEKILALLAQSQHCFLAVVAGLCIVYSLGYGFGYNDSRSLVFRLVFLNFSGAGVVGLFFGVKRKYIRVFRSKVLLFIYFLLIVSIVLNSDSVQNLIFHEENSTISCVFGVVVLMNCSKFVVIFKFQVFFLTHLAVALLYLFLHIPSGQDLLQTLLEFFLLALSLFIETARFYYIERYSREAYLANKGLEKSCEQPMTDIENITSSITQALDIIKSLIFSASSSEKSLAQVQNLLQKVLLIFSTKENIYQLNIEKLTSNLDQEDQVFVKEFASNTKSFTHPVLKANLIRSNTLPKSYEMEELIGVLKQISKSWNFDMFFIQQCTDNKPIQTISRYVISKYHLDELFRIPEIVTLTYFERLEKDYKQNPYHNSTHAADVLSSFLYLMHNSNLISEITDYEIFASVLACLGHDVSHPGVTNRFLINTRDDLAVKYNDISVLEMMHCSITFAIMKGPNSDIFQSVNQDQFYNIRLLIIEMILSTDMSKHFELIGKIKTKIKALPDKPIDTPEHRMEILKIVIKAADVGHAAKNRVLHLKWTNLIVAEFFDQGDREKKLNLPVSMYCDREKTNVAKSQMGFIKNIVLPLYESLNTYLSAENIEKECIAQLKMNCEDWSRDLEWKRLMTVIPERPESLMSPVQLKLSTLIS